MRKTVFKTRSCANFWKGGDNSKVLEVLVGDGGTQSASASLERADGRG